MGLVVKHLVCSHLVCLSTTLSELSCDDDSRGLLLLVGFLALDGFTSTYQEKLFKEYTISKYNQMVHILTQGSLVFLLRLLNHILSQRFVHQVSARIGKTSKGDLWHPHRESVVIRDVTNFAFALRRPLRLEPHR